MKAETNNYRGIVVSETHWDREWYLSFQEFRKWLVKNIDDLIENLPKNPKFKSFMLDGQTVVIEDYLEIRKNKREDFFKLIRDKRIEVGPYYVLADEFLESGEGLIRNLLLGHKICFENGLPVMKSGYVPDTFGHIWQHPQILKGFGINSMYYYRGYPPVFGNHEEYKGKNEDTPLEHYYQAPDGTKVFVSHLLLGYGNFSGVTDVKSEQFLEEGEFPWVEAVFRIQRIFQQMIPRLKTHTVLLFNGTDHRQAEWEIPDLIEKFNNNEDLQEDFPIKLEHGTLEDYYRYVMEEVKERNLELPTLTGEARGSMYTQVTPGCISTRMNLKLFNWKCQRELERYSEPFTAMSWLFGADSQDEYIELAWKWLIKNHPHDSICGCSLDRVHEDMITRFNWSFDNANDAARYACAAILTGINTERIAENFKEKFPKKDIKILGVFNPNPYEGPFFLEDYVHLKPNRRYKLYDHRGNEIKDYRIKYIPDYRKNVKEGQYLFKQFHGQWSLGKVALYSDSIPAVGFTTLVMVEEQYVKGSEMVGNVDSEESKINEGVGFIPQPIEGKDMEISFNKDGSINILDKETGILYKNINTFEDGADDGDEYDYAPLEDEKPLLSKDCIASYKIVEVNGLFTDVNAQITFSIPYELIGDADTKRVRSEKKVDLKLNVDYRIHKKIKRVDIRVNVINKAKGHRLRALFPTGINARHSYADDHFMVMKRTVELPRDDGWYQDMQGIYHHDTFVDICSEEDGADNGEMGYGIAVFNKGLPEFEIIETPSELKKDNEEISHSIALTLFRSVAWLSQKGHLGRKSGLNGPNLQTPGAQMMDYEFDFEYAVYPHKGNWKGGSVYKAAHAYNSPPRFMDSEHKLRNEVLEKEIPNERSLIKFSNENIVLSALKRSGRIYGAKDGLIIRFFNPGPSEESLKIHLGFNVRKAFITNLLEEDIEELPIKRNDNGADEIEMNVAPYKIVTLRLDPEDR